MHAWSLYPVVSYLCLQESIVNAVSAESQVVRIDFAFAHQSCPLHTHTRDHAFQVCVRAVMMTSCIVSRALAFVVLCEKQSMLNAHSAPFTGRSFLGLGWDIRPISSVAFHQLLGFHTGLPD